MTLREQAAIAAMNAILMREKDIYVTDSGVEEFVARLAVENADALIARLNLK